MNRRLAVLGGLCLLLALTALPAAARAYAAAGPDSMLGDWNGALKVGDRTLRLAFHLTRFPDGKLAGTMDSPDQGAFGLSLDSVVVSGDTLRLTFARIGAGYQGVRTPDAPVLRGTWSQSGVTFPLDLGRGAAPERRRPQDPVPPFPYDEEEARIANPAGHDTLAGTLTRPRGAGPFPAALLVTGSGPQNRDEELLGHRPFRVLADHLTRAGLVVLRCDDRGTGASTGDFPAATTQDFADDARAELAWLRSRPEVDRARVGIIGHSEGGVIGPMVAAGGRDVAFLVLMAGTGVPGDSLLFLQSTALLRASGEPDSVVERSRRTQRQLLEAVRSETDTTALRARLTATLARAEQEMPEGERRLLGPAFAQRQVAVMSSPWYRGFVAYDPRPALRRTTCPVLAVNGSLDLQVPPRENLPAIAAALRQGGNRDVETVELPGLNHLFQTASTGLPVEYGTIEETIAPAALDTMTTWVLRHVGGGRRPPAGKKPAPH